MNEFIVKYQRELQGTLCGFDRLVFMGTLWRNQLAGLKGYLWSHGLGAKDFAGHAEAVSKRVTQTATATFEKVGRPVLYLNSGKDDKQQIALDIAARDGIRQGPICALKTVELCWSYKIGMGNSGPELQVAQRKCLFVYQYWMHDVFGFMSARLQTWFPFPIHIYLNGREWLARQMDRASIGYHRQRNCFTWIEDVARAQQLMKQQQRVHWSDLFDRIAHKLHPLLYSELSEDYSMKYYWTCSDSEWAMDFLFRDPNFLRRLTPRLIKFGMLNFSSPDVLRFMGKKVTRQGDPMGNALAGFELGPESTHLRGAHQASFRAELRQALRQGLRTRRSDTPSRGHHLGAEIFQDFPLHRDAGLGTGPAADAQVRGRP